MPIEKNKILDNLIKDMFETMYNANGIGLAAPQIGKSMRLFIIDSSPIADQEEFKHLEGYREVFINAKIIEESGVAWSFEEGCLSIPNIREYVERIDRINISYYNEKWEKQVKSFDGIIARIIQHEYDHIEGVLFTDKISSLKRMLLKKKLKHIKNGIIEADYPMKFVS